MEEAGERLRREVDRFLTPRPSSPTPRDEELLRGGDPLALECGLAATAWGTGPTVLLAHGWESRRTHWGAFVPALVAAGFRAVAVDAHAHGDSPGATSNVWRYGRSLVEVGREIGPLAGVVGHSFGAGATIVALDLGLQAERAVVIAGFASVEVVTERWARKRLAPEEIPAFVRLVEEAVGTPVTNLDLAKAAGRLTVPALIVHDRGDEDIPLEDGLALAASWPGARLLVTERYGHRRVLIAREVVREVAAFLRDDG